MDRVGSGVGQKAITSLSQLSAMFASFFNQPILLLPESQRPSINLLKNEIDDQKKSYLGKEKKKKSYPKERKKSDPDLGPIFARPAGWSVLGRVLTPCHGPKVCMCP